MILETLARSPFTLAISATPAGWKPVVFRHGLSIWEGFPDDDLEKAALIGLTHLRNLTINPGESHEHSEAKSQEEARKPKPGPADYGTGC